MLDVSVSFQRFRFLGLEFLTWLLYALTAEPEAVSAVLGDGVSMAVGNRIKLSNRQNETPETVTIQGEDADLDEAVIAMKKGAMVEDLHVTLESGEATVSFRITGESLALSGFRMPKGMAGDDGEDREGALLERMYILDQSFTALDAMFRQFLALRLSLDWEREVKPKVRKWLTKTASP